MESPEPRSPTTKGLSPRGNHAHAVVDYNDQEQEVECAGAARGGALGVTGGAAELKTTVAAHEASQVLRRKKLRTVVVTFGIFIALMCVIVALSHAHHNNRGDDNDRNGVNTKPHHGGSDINRAPVPHNCVTPFGSPIGSAFGVVSYSNCNGDYTSDVNNFQNVKVNPLQKDSKTVRVFSGMKWQCVEYGRRFLMRTKRVAFGSVEGASDIFKLRYVHDIVNSSRTYHFPGFVNGASTELPQIGDLLIYPVQPGGFPFGHVIVVVNITSTEVHIAEQNWDSAVWKHVDQGYSRALRLSQNAGRFLVSDPGNYTIQGWKRVEEQK